MGAHILLVNTNAGNLEGVRFPSAADAYDWVDANGIEYVQCIRLITKTEAEREAIQ